MQSSPASTPLPAHTTLKQEFETFLRKSYTEPPSLGDPHPAVQRQFRQLQFAFYVGCLKGMDRPHDFAGEIDELLATMLGNTAGGRA